MRSFTLAILMAWTAGCGLITQGFHQSVPLASSPPGAQATFREVDTTTPGVAVVRRRSRGNFVYRAGLAGYHPACQVIACDAPRWIRVLDSIPAAIPLLIDLAAGTLARCADGNITLDRIKPGDVPFKIALDDRLMKAANTAGANPCTVPYLFDADFMKRAEKTIVTNGPLQRPYRELGTVSTSAMGSDVVRWGSYFGWVSVAERTFSKATPDQMNWMLQGVALRQYGEALDAIVNVNYETNPRNDVFATGLAVQFVEPADAVTTEQRLERLKGLREKGLITEEEYRRHREEAIRGGM